MDYVSPGRGGRGGGRGGGGRGGGDWGRGGGGRGGRGGGNSAAKDRERRAIALLAANSSAVTEAPVDVRTNLMPIDFSRCTFHQYRMIIEYKKNAIDLKGDGWKFEAQRALLRHMEKHTGSDAATKHAVCTGQHILLPAALPEDQLVTMDFDVKDKTGRNVTTRTYGLSLVYDGEVKMQLPAQSTMANALIGEAVSRVYRNQIGQRYIDVDRTSERHNIVLMDAVIPKVMQTTVAPKKQMDVLQLDIAVAVARSKEENCGQLLRDLREKVKSPDAYRHAAAEMLVGQRVGAFYARDRSCLLKVKRVLDGETTSSEFSPQRCPGKTYVMYFKERYGVDIAPQQPLLLCKPVSGSGRPNPYPAELLQPMFLSDAQKSMLPALCGVYPEERLKKVQEVAQRLLKHSAVSAFLAAYEIRFESRPLSVTGAVLPAPTVYIPRGRNYFAVNPATEENTRQQGFTRALQQLQHTNDSAAQVVKSLLMDANLERDVPQLKKLLAQYAIALPNAGVMPFRGGQSAASISNAFCVVRMPTMEKPLYNEYKAAFAARGVVSQVVARPANMSVQHMIVQQMAAKIGQLNYVIDAHEAAPELLQSAQENLLVIGVDVGASNTTVRQGHKSIRKDLFTTAFVAFCVHGKTWSPYCNHYQVDGRETTLAEDSASSSSPTTRAAQPARQDPNDAVNARIDVFLAEAVAHFGLQKKSGTVLIYRGSPSEGEIPRSGVFENVVKKTLPKWRYALLTAQARSHTRFAWSPEKESAGSITGVCNPPRGFMTELGGDAALIDKAHNTADKQYASFYLTGANCELGHASNAFYVVLARTPSLPLTAVEKITYAMGFMYPNKADALPATLPMKCAAEYARKFGSLGQVRELHVAMRPSMHYL